MDCYSCRHVGTVPGSAHVCCNHPKVGNSSTDPVSAIIAMFDGRADELGIKMNPHGVKCGWCSWPIEFDSIWIENCNG